MVLDHSSWEVRIIPFCSLVFPPYKSWEIAFNQFFKDFYLNWFKVMAWKDVLKGLIIVLVS